MPVMGNVTAFRQWRDRMGWTQEQAAEALGVTKSQVANWDAGVDRGSKRPSKPGLAVRSLMSVLIRGESVQPWPE